MGKKMVLGGIVVIVVVVAIIAVVMMNSGFKSDSFEELSEMEKFGQMNVKFSCAVVGDSLESEASLQLMETLMEEYRYSKEEFGRLSEKYSGSLEFFEFVEEYSEEYCPGVTIIRE